MEYYDTNIDKVQTEEELLARGLKLEKNFLLGISIFPLFRDIPDYDKNLYRVEKDGDPIHLDHGTNTRTQRYKIVPLELENAKENMRKKVALERWRSENTDLEISGNIYSTSQESRANMLLTIQGSEMYGKKEVYFKSKTGYIDMSVSDLKSIFGKITEYIEELFKREKVFLEKVDSAKTIDSLKNIEF